MASVTPTADAAFRVRATLSPQMVLELQRAAGNSAVAHLLSRPPAGAHEQLERRRVPTGGGGPTGRGYRVQRKVGFEFEDAFWKAFRKYPALPLRAIRRGEVLTSTNTFAMEGDDSEGADKPSIEFVTKPFTTDNAGVQQLNHAFLEIRRIMARLGQFAGPNRDGDLQNTDSSGFVKGYQHGLGQTLWFSQGKANARFKMQATHGVSLEDIPILMQYFGTGVPGETVPQTGDRQQARMFMYNQAAGPGGADRQMTDLLGSAPALADVAIARLQNSPMLNVHRRQAFAANTSALRGFLAQVMLYVKLLSAPTTLPKYLIPLLARTNFATMFGLIPLDSQKRRLARNGAAPLIDAVVHAGNSQSYIQDIHGTAVDVNYGPNVSLIRALKPDLNNAILTTLTISDWLEGITTGSDYLSPTTMEAWLVANTTLSPQESKHRAGYLESFSVLGKNPGVSSHTDPADIIGHTALAIFENRSIQGTGYFTADQAHAAALTYLQFFINLKQAGGAPGTFPNAAAPAAGGGGPGVTRYLDPTALLGYFNI